MQTYAITIRRTGTNNCAACSEHAHLWDIINETSKLHLTEQMLN